MFEYNDTVMRDTLAGLLTQTATVYIANGTNRKYDQVATSSLKCRLEPVSRSSTTTNDQRSEAATMGVLYYDPSYTMPDRAQITIDAFPGQRWNLQYGTAWPDNGAGGVTVMWHVDLVRVQA